MSGLGAMAPPRGALGRDLRLLPVAAAAWIAAALLVGAPAAAAVVAGGAWMLVALALVLAIRSPRRGALGAAALSLAALALVATTVGIRADIRAPPSLGEQRGVVEALLVVTEEVAAGSERFRGIAAALGEARGEIPVLVVGAVVDEDLGIGATVRLDGSASLVGPGGGIAAIVVAAGDEPVAIVAPPPAWLDWGNGLRSGFRSVAGGLPGDGGALLTGLAIGDDRDVPAGLAEAMRTSSLTHLTAVSGANCAIVVGAVMVGGALLGVRRRVRIAAALLVLGAFVVLVTPQPSVVRAAVMAAFALGGLAVARPMRGLPLLSLAVAGILVADPWAARELGFVLSALATSGLLVLSGPLGRLLARWLPQPLAVALAVPAAAQLAVQPAMALVDASLPSYGIVANLLAVPAAPLATVAGLVACLIAPLAPPLAVAAAWVAWLPSSWIAGVASTFAGMPGARLPWPDGLLGVVLYALVAVAIAVAVLGGGRVRIAAGLLVAATAAGYAGIAATWQLTGMLSRPAEWQVAMCDVGQGDAAVVRSAGQVALIDTGPEPAPLDGCLDGLGVDRIDLLVLTHFDRDHVGGVETVVGRVDRVLVGPPDASSDARVLAPLTAGGARVEQVARGDAGALGALRWRVLWPRAGPGVEPGNDASVVVRFVAEDTAACPPGGCLAMTFLGDLGEAAQSGLLANGPVGPADVVKVSHHGSADQSERLYQALDPAVALIGVGADNGYGHPTDRLLGLLERTGAEVGRTDAEGLLLVARDATGGLLLWRERGG